MKTTIIAALTFGFCLCFSQLNAKPTQADTKPLPSDSVKKTLIDPVCKMKVKPGADKTVVYKKITYGFCSESCKQKFSKSPEQYIKK